MGPFAANSPTADEGAREMHHRILGGRFGKEGHEPVAFRPAVDQTTELFRTVPLAYYLNEVLLYGVLLHNSLQSKSYQVCSFSTV